MSDKPDGGPAFPTGGTHTHRDGSVMSVEHRGGMTLRDYFAGQALVGLCACPTIHLPGLDDYARHAYEQADAMLAERAK